MHKNMLKRVHRVQCQENVSGLTLNYNETITTVAIYSYHENLSVLKYLYFNTSKLSDSQAHTVHQPFGAEHHVFIMCSVILKMRNGSNC